jgi:tetratricopeptide (TPR) repeat protein
VVAMLLAALAPASLMLLRDRILRLPAMITVLVSAALVFGSGSRTVWLAVAVGAVIVALTSRPSRRLIGAAAGLAAILAAASLVTGWLPAVLERVFASSTVVYRADIWANTLALMADDPITGVGPGGFGLGITLTDLLDQYAFNARHADNAFLQLAGEAGLLGLIGGACQLAAVWVGRRVDLRHGRPAVLGLILLGAMCLVNNPTDSPNLAALVVIYAAMVAPSPSTARAVTVGESIRRWRWGYVTGVVGSTAAIALAVALVNVAALAHLQARSAIAGGNLESAREYLSFAFSLDQNLGMYRREYGAVLAATRESEAALSQFTQAVRLNPADTAALRALALQRHMAGDDSGAQEAAMLAATARPLFAENWVVLGIVADDAVADQALRQGILVSPWLPGSAAWNDRLPVEMRLSPLLQGAARATDLQPSARRAMATYWLRAATGTASPPDEIIP